MSEKNEPAFPVTTNRLGATLRDYFAGQALAGYLAGRDCSISFKEAAVEAYSYADAMLTARESTS